MQTDAHAKSSPNEERPQIVDNLVSALYRSVLDREPSAQERASKVSAVTNSSLSLQGLIESFLCAEEFPAIRARHYWTERRATSFVSALYENMLARDLDDEGRTTLVPQLVKGHTTAEKVVKTLQDSSEFKNVNFSKIWEGATSNYVLDHGATADQLQQLWAKTATYWRQAGTDSDEVYFSVLAEDGMKGALSEEAIRSFYGTGREFIDFIWNVLERVQAPQARRVLDFGAGVGRLSYWALEQAEELIAVDFSAGHLDFLRDNLRRMTPSKADRVKTMHLQDLEDFGKLPSDIDVAYSYITLQHNTPPVMAHITTRLLQTLRPGGLAFLHIPIHHPFYSFTVEGYLADPRSGQHMEMHILPREELRTLARDNGCTLVDSYGFGGTIGVYSEVFMFQRA